MTWLRQWGASDENGSSRWPPHRDQSYFVWPLAEAFAPSSQSQGGGGGAGENGCEGSHSSCLKYELSVPNANFPYQYFLNRHYRIADDPRLMLPMRQSHHCVQQQLAKQRWECDPSRALSVDPSHQRPYQQNRATM
ncbi:hypothetical protein ACHAXA_011144 [Cyclostephanos tholiformis]|uniref:Uncharacterized protein n=1 Tax=Cyclostephanos tholiformis TaxID=382380 RepID=A0ABD3SF80_9STRA